MAKVIKEIIIMLVICLLTMLVLAIALYRYIPNRKAVPEVVTYTASEDVQDLLEDNIDTKSDQDNVILTYEVTASDLSGYQSTNTYVPESQIHLHLHQVQHRQMVEVIAITVVIIMEHHKKNEQKIQINQQKVQHQVFTMVKVLNN